MLFCHLYYHQKAKYYISTTQFNNWTRDAEKCEICESPTTPERDYWQKNA